MLVFVFGENNALKIAQDYKIAHLKILIEYFRSQMSYV
jgi:hypothetical protein